MENNTDRGTSNRLDNPANRVTFVDGLKGLACLIVFVFHYNAAFVVNDVLLRNLPQPVNMLTDGSWAVYLFLLLSGFSISQAIMKSNNYQGQILKRYFRLSLPLAFVQVLAFIIGVLDLFTTVDVSITTNNAWIGSFYNSFNVSLLIKCILFIVPWSADYARPFIAPGWMMCYIFWGTFLVIILEIGTKGLSMRKKFLVYLLFMTFLLHLQYMESIVIGAMISQIHNSNLFERNYKRYEFISIVFLVASLVIYSYIGIPFISTAMIVLFVFTNKHIQEFLNLKPIQFFGKISLWVYLLHWPILCSVGGGRFCQIIRKKSYLVILCESSFLLYLNGRSFFHGDEVFR